MDYTDDDGDTFNPSADSGINSVVDHQTIGSGPYHQPPPPTTLYPRAVYYCAQDVADANCALSIDGGQTFGPAVPIYTIAQCGGIHGHVKVAPDGTVYVPNKSCGGKQAVVASEDDGTTWEVRPVPTSVSGDTDPSLGIASDGTLYLGYQANQGGNSLARIAVSHDRGKTWVNDTDAGAALGIKNMVFPEVIAGDPNRSAFAFFGTTTGGDYQVTTDFQAGTGFQGIWYLYVATTYDGGVTWTTQNVTPDDPIQRGSIRRLRLV